MAGTEVGSLYYDLNIDDKNLKSQLDNADKHVKGFGDRVSKYWGDSVDASKKFMLGVAAVGAATVAFGVTSVKAYNESQQALTQLDAVLKSTGGAAGITRDAAIELSREIQRTTSVSDETALAVENMGLTFTAIGKNIFPEATKTAIDMATALNHGMKPSTEQATNAMKLMGKALQDPDAGLGALKRVGVNTDELAKKFVGLTDKGEKQRLILQELATEFGGSAAAQAKTFAGRIDQMKNSFNDLQEQVGEVIVKALGPVADWFSRVIEVINENGGILKMLQKLWHDNKDTILIVAGAIAGALLPAIIAMTGAFASFLLTLAPWAALGAGIVLLFQHFNISMSDVTNAVMATYHAVSDFLLPIWDAMKKLWDAMFPSIAALAAALWQNLLPALMQIWDAVVRLWNALNPALMEALKIIAYIIGALLVAQIWLMINGTRIAIEVISFLASVISNLINWISNLISWYGNAYAAIINFFKALPGRVAGFLGDVGSWLYNAGKDLIQGMINGVMSKITGLKDAVRNGVQSAVNSVKNFLGINSPSTVFMGIGKNVTEGFVKGINQTAGLAMNAMDKLGNNIITPTVMTGGTNSGGGAASGPSSSVRHGDTIIKIDQINNAQDENYVLRRINDNQYLESVGLTPVGG